MDTTILLIEDDQTLQRMLRMHLEEQNYTVITASSWFEAHEHIDHTEPDLILLDYRLPDVDGRSIIEKLCATYPTIVITAYGSIKDAIHAMRCGVFDYIVKPFNLEELEITIIRALETAKLKTRYRHLKEQQRQVSATSMIGNSRSFRKVVEMIHAVSKTDMTVLIQGESGVGKELVARELHHLSLRVDNSFVALDCCSLHEELFESELFGHEKGSFTGADRQKKGLIEVASDSTLFLDEIGEITQLLQAKLLRVLETGQFRRLGGNKTLSSNARIIAATNRNLEKLAAEGKYREDLFYRLNAFEITIPPLRERKNDIQLLAKHFVENNNFSGGIKKTLSPQTLEKLENYEWPGNIRELKNMIERAIILSAENSVIEPKHLSLSSNDKNRGIPDSGLQLSFEKLPSLKELQAEYIQKMERRFKGHRANIAKAMGISERNLYRLLKKTQGKRL